MPKRLFFQEGARGVCIVCPFKREQDTCDSPERPFDHQGRTGRFGKDLARDTSKHRSFTRSEAPGAKNDQINRFLVRHTPKGGTVAVTLQRERNTISATIGDNGCGIPESALPRIFDRFYQVDNIRSANTGHGGLGLAIVKRILDLHQQSIQVESQPDQGTTFHFSLEIAPV